MFTSLKCLLQQQNSILGTKLSTLLLLPLSSSLFVFHEDVFPELAKFMACIFGVILIYPSRDMMCRGGLREEISLETVVSDGNYQMFPLNFQRGFKYKSYGPFHKHVHLLPGLETTQICFFH
jgi:hypothetical protein